jgi:plastocyanin
LKRSTYGAAVIIVIVVVALAAYVGTQPSSPSTTTSSTTTSQTSTATSTTTTTPPEPVEVAIQGLDFVPQNITVPQGTVVTWVNYDTVEHTVTSSSGPARILSGIISPGASYAYTFTRIGIYTYNCTIHSYMTGTVTVTGP